MNRASMIVICLLASACSATLPEVRPSHTGFGAAGAVLQPLEDGKRDLAAGRNGLAIRRFGEALAREPRSLDALNGMAVAYAGIGRHDVAQAYFERALEVDPADVATLNNYGRSLIEQGRFRDARPFLEQALRHAPENERLVVATNMLSLRDAAPPALLAAFRKDAEPEPGPGTGVIRVATNRYRLLTAAPSAGPTPLFRLAASPRPRPRAVAAPAAFTPPLPKPRPLGLHERPAVLRASLERVLRRPAPTAPLPSPAKPAAAVPQADVEFAAVQPHANIRTVMERRIAGTGLDLILDGVLPEPASHLDIEPSETGEWT